MGRGMGSCRLLQQLMIRIMGNEGDDGSDRVDCDCDDDEKLASATALTMSTISFCLFNKVFK